MNKLIVINFKDGKQIKLDPAKIVKMSDEKLNKIDENLNKKDNSRSNLMVLCYNCHYKEHNDKKIRTRWQHNIK